MTKRFIFFILLITSSILYGQAPTRISYQAIVRNSSNALVANTEISIQTSILHGDIEGDAVYMERHFTKTNKNALVTIEIGAGIVLDGNIDSIDWSAGPYFIKTEIDINGGVNFSISGVSQLLSVPYALHANTVSSYDEKDPTIPQWAKEPEKPAYSYSEITDTPTKLSDFDRDVGLKYFKNDAGYLTSISVVLLTGNQTINGNKKFVGKVSVNTPTADTDAATKAYVDAVKKNVDTIRKDVDAMKKEIEDRMISEGSFSVSDGFGNFYKVIKIGTQVWMAENLRVTRYNDGSPIQRVEDKETWRSTTSGAYSYYANDYNNYGSQYGVLYNHYAISDSRGLCPTGWHVPSLNEYNTLISYLIEKGYYTNNTKGNGVSKALSSNTGWAVSTNEGVVGNDLSLNNITGFSALPGGWRYEEGTFREEKTYSYWWASTAYDDQYSYCVYISTYTSNFTIDNLINKMGLYVRCIRD